MRSVFPSLIRNEALRSRLGADLLQDTLTHAYLLEGAAGSGKHTLAQSIAMALCLRAQDRRCFPPALRQVLRLPKDRRGQLSRHSHGEA